MNKTVVLSFFILSVILFSCGPAAEDKKLMHEKAKVFQDSIANVIRTTIAEAEVTTPAQPVITPAATAASTSTAK